MQLFQYTFFLNALWATLFVGLITGILGSYVVVRRMVFISGGITHSSFAGLGFGFFVGQSPTFYAILAAILSALGVDFLNRRGHVREDSAIAAIWALGMALGVLFTFLTPGYTPNLSSFLFGNILLTTRSELLILGIYALLTILFVVSLYRPLLHISFDPEYATISGLPTKLVECTMLIWISIGIVLSIGAIGIMMLMSMLTLPQMTVARFTHNFRVLIIGSSLLTISGLLASLFLSYYINLPTGAFSVLIFALIYLLSNIFPKSTFSVRRKLSYIINLLLLALLPSCTLLQRVERYNFLYLSKIKLYEIEEELRYAPPSMHPPRCIHLYDESGKYTSILIAIITDAEKQERTPQLNETIERAKWLIGSECDTIVPSDALEAIIQDKKADRYSRLQAIRYRLFAKGKALKDSSHALLSLWKSLSYHPTEIWLADYFLLLQNSGNKRVQISHLKRTAKEPVQWALLALEEANRVLTSEQIIKAWRLIESLPEDLPITIFATEAIRPLLIQSHHYPQALAAHLRLPQESQMCHPYRLLTEYEQEIALLNSYENAQSEPEIALSESPQEGLFRVRWGSVSNVDNWSMLRTSTPLGYYHKENGENSHQLLITEKEYKKIKAQLSELFSPNWAKQYE